MPCLKVALMVWFFIIFKVIYHKQPSYPKKICAELFLPRNFLNFNKKGFIEHFLLEVR